MSWRLVYTKLAQKDARRLKESGLVPKAKRLLSILTEDPFQSPPEFKKLVGDLKGAFSRRINIQHRLVYEVVPEKKTVKVIRMWTDYS